MKHTSHYLDINLYMSVHAYLLVRVHGERIRRKACDRVYFTLLCDCLFDRKNYMCRYIDPFILTDAKDARPYTANVTLAALVQPH